MAARLAEALRYMGMGTGRAPDMEARVAALLATLEDSGMQPRYVMRTAALDWHSGMPVIAASTALPSLALPGAMARQMLSGCHHAAILVCTMGAAFERMQRMKRSDALTALMLDACGSVLVEEGCDQAASALARKHPHAFLTDRFSPGYGDLPLTLQPALLASADAFRRLGVQATESCMLIPQKTVTAIIGLSDQPQPARIRGCGYCALHARCPYAHSGGCAPTENNAITQGEEDQ